MKGSIVLIGKNKLIYKGLTYDYKSFFEKIKLRRKRYIIILDEDIYVKKISRNSKDILNEGIAKIKEESFGKDEEYLIDYKFNKKEEILYIYAIKGGGKVSKLCYGANKMQVVPIQFYVMKKLKKKIKDKYYRCIFKYKETYYYYSSRSGLIEESCIYKDLEILLKKISIEQSEYVLHVENNIYDSRFKDWGETREVEFRGIFNEGIFA